MKRFGCQPLTALVFAPVRSLDGVHPRNFCEGINFEEK